MLYWITLYYGCLNNLYGADRADCIAAMDDDARFDRWMQEFDRKRAAENAQADRQRPGGAPSGAASRGTPMSKDAYIKQFDVEFKEE